MTLRLHQKSYNNENLLTESLIAEAIEMHGVDFLYIPRSYVAKDEILGEDRLSTFKHAYPIVAYMENTDGGLQGQGMFMQKFGLAMEQSLTILIARRHWGQAVGKYGTSILPNRPAEGDLMFLEIGGTRKLFEVMFVEHEQHQFYQLGQFYSYRLNLELFRYASEKLETGIEAVDDFESLKSLDVNVNPSADTSNSYGDNDKFKQRDTHVFDVNNPFGDL